VVRFHKGDRKKVYNPTAKPFRWTYDAIILKAA